MLRYDTHVLPRLLHESECSVAELARRSGLRRATIHSIVRQQSRPRADILARLAHGLRVPIQTFFIETEEGASRDD